MAMKQGLYAQVVMIRQKESYNKKLMESTKNYYFQGQSARSGRWFNIDHDWLEETFMTCEPHFFKNSLLNNLGLMIQKHMKYLEYQLVMQKQQKVQFHLAAPVIRYHQKSYIIVVV